MNITANISISLNYKIKQMYWSIKYKFQFVTSSKSRTIESAKSFIEGAFPDDIISLGAPNDTFLKVR